MGEGLLFSAKVKASLTILFLSVPSFGTMSSSNTSQPTLAKWHAMRLPMTPLPRTATFWMFRLVIDSNVV